MIVRDILSSKGDFVATLSPSATVRELIDALAEHNVGAVVVTDASGKLAGIVSERDVVRALPTDTGLLDRPVSDIMTVEVAVAAPEEPVDQLMRTMTEGRFRHVPIVEKGRLVGVVSIGDVVKRRIGELEGERESLVGYISGG